MGAHGPGERIAGRYVLEARLGEGGFGEVWRARDAVDGGVVAVKLLHLHKHAGVAFERFRREGEILRALDHPNLARALAVGAHEEQAFIAMEFVPGPTLRKLLAEASERGRPLPLAEASELLDQLTRAIAATHELGIVHRDLKTENLIVSNVEDRPRLKVVDFGIARLLHVSSTRATTHGWVIGSPLYFSPEQVRGLPADERADVFAVATIAFEVLTLHRTWLWDEAGRPVPAHQAGAHLRRKQEVLDIPRRIARGTRPRPTVVRPDLPARLDRVILEGLAVDPRDRTPDIATLRRELLVALGASDLFSLDLEGTAKDVAKTRAERAADRGLSLSVVVPRELDTGAAEPETVTVPEGERPGEGTQAIAQLPTAIEREPEALLQSLAKEAARERSELGPRDPGSDGRPAQVSVRVTSDGRRRPWLVYVLAGLGWVVAGIVVLGDRLGPGSPDPATPPGATSGDPPSAPGVAVDEAPRPLAEPTPPIEEPPAAVREARPPAGRRPSGPIGAPSGPPNSSSSAGPADSARAPGAGDSSRPVGAGRAGPPASSPSSRGGLEHDPRVLALEALLGGVERGEVELAEVGARIAKAADEVADLEQRRAIQTCARTASFAGDREAMRACLRLFSP